MIKKRKKSKAEGIIEKRNASTDKVAVIWSRVSSADQFKHNNSIQTQIDACMEYCKRNGIRVKKCDYGARNESAKVSGEKFLEMVTEVQRDPEVNTIVCYDYDRFSRNASEGIMWKTKLKSEGITLNAINQPIPQDNFMAESIENMMIIVANMDNAARKHKCTEGMKACIKRGEWYSRPPLGYDSRKEGKKHIITVNEKGKILRKAFEWKANENLSNEEIVRRLNARGLKMYKQRLSEILRNPFYCGYIEHRYLGEGKRIISRPPEAKALKETSRVETYTTHSCVSGSIRAATGPANPVLPIFEAQLILPSGVIKATPYPLESAEAVKNPLPSGATVVPTNTVKPFSICSRQLSMPGSMS